VEELLVAHGITCADSAVAAGAVKKVRHDHRRSLWIIAGEPSREAVERANSVLDLCTHTPLSAGTAHDQQGACGNCIARALDAVAREREAAVWEEAAKIGGHKASCITPDASCTNNECAAYRIRWHAARAAAAPEREER
jgi:hypothetical protein